MTRALALISLALSISCSRGLPTMSYVAPRLGLTSEAQGFAGLGVESISLAARAYPRARRPAGPLSLTASDGSGLRLVALGARGVVDGPLAFTELQLTFHNPSDRRIEGRFDIELPPSASISRFAMKIGETWQEAEVVEQSRARQAYETFLHARVDPALLETRAGNSFSARVSPIGPGEYKQLIVSYSHELASGAEPYRIPLRGLPAIDDVDIYVRAGTRVDRVRERAFAPVRDYELAVRGGPDAVAAGGVVAFRIAPPVVARDDELDSLIVLFDTSASGAAAYRRQVDALRGLVGELARTRPGMGLRVVAFDQAIEPVFAGRAAGFGRPVLDALLARRPLGASNLEAALAWASRASDNARVLLISDGIVTAGARELSALRAALAAGTAPRRLDALAMSGQRDEMILRGLAAGALERDGVVLSAQAGARQWAARLGARAVGDMPVRVAGAEWVWPAELSGLQAGDHAVVLAQMPASWRGKTVTVTVGDRTVRFQPQPAEAPLIDREWAHARIESLIRERSLTPAVQISRRDKLRAEIVELSTAHRVLSPFTSFLVLETDGDYVQFGLDRQALVDVVTVDATGLRVLRRGAAPTVAGRGKAARRPATPAAATPVAANGQLRGVVTDSRNGERLPGATIVATSPALVGEQVVITDETGNYLFTGLAAGVYALDIYYSDQHTRRDNIAVGPDRGAALNVAIDTSASRGEVIEISGRPPIIDTSSTTTGTTITQSMPARVAGKVETDGVNVTGGSVVERRSLEFAATTSLESSYTFEEPELALTGARAPLGRSSDKAVRGRLRAILARIEDGEHDRAVVDALAWRAAEPGDLLALIALGEALEARGCYALAARAYGSIADLYPGRAEMLRYAAARLLRMGDYAAELAADLAAAAVADRPDHPGGYRLLAYARAMAGHHAEAADALLGALGQKDDPRGRFSRARRLLGRDLAVIAAAWLDAEPGKRTVIRDKLAAVDVMVPTTPSVEVVLAWENDATDLDLFVTDDAGELTRRQSRDGGIEADIADGFGPEAFAFAHVDPAKRYRVWADYSSQAMAGFGLGYAQIVVHDGTGKLSIDTRPFAVMTEAARVDLGSFAIADTRRAHPPASVSRR